MEQGGQLAIAILAAGRSVRFGEADKLCALLDGKMLGLHVSDELSVLEATNKWVITARSDHPCENRWHKAGFEPVVNPRSSDGMGTSVSLAASLADASRADTLLLCLADMPRVPVSHFRALVDTATSMAADGIVASMSGKVKMPPACFRQDQFSRLAGFDSDIGARSLIRGADAIQCEPSWLIDIDDPQGLERLNAS